jgi:hypothetical protein
MSKKNSNDTIGNLSRDIPPSRSVPQPNAPPRIPHHRLQVMCTFDTSDSRLYRSGLGAAWCTAGRPYKCRDNISVTLIPPPSKSFPNYHPPVTLLSTMYNLTQCPTKNQQQCRESHIVELSASNARDLSSNSRQNDQSALRLVSEYTCFLLFFPRIKSGYVKL